MPKNDISKVDQIVKEIIEMLPMIYDDEVTDKFKENHFLVNSDETQILSKNESEVEALANLFDQLYGEGTCCTGYYDPIEDERNGCIDAYTGLYYVSFE